MICLGAIADEGHHLDHLTVQRLYEEPLSFSLHARDVVSGKVAVLSGPREASPMVTADCV